MPRRTRFLTLLGLVLLASCRGEPEKAAAPESVAAAPAAAAPAPSSMPNPFGPAWDPAGPEPTEPRESGPGLQSLTVAMQGPVVIDEAAGSGAPALHGLLVDLRLAAASTTPLMDARSVYVDQGGGKLPLHASCLPTAGLPLSVWQAEGTRLSEWTVHLGERVVRCGERTARLAMQADVGGYRLTSSPNTAWAGPVLLLFREAPAAGATLHLGNLEAAIPAR